MTFLLQILIIDIFKSTILRLTMTQQNFHKYFTLYFILFGIAISSFGAIISYMFQINEIDKRMDKGAKEVFEIKANSILKPSIKNMDNIVEALAKNKTILEFIATRNPNKQEELEQIFLAVTSSQNTIMQARVICNDGKELIRIDRKKENDEPFIVAKENFQDKSNRDYFQIVSKMKEPTLWHSKMDLNIENGKVEIPYRPTLRIAMPLFENGQFIGMVIVNLLTNNLFASIGTSSAFEHFIIDKDKNYIMHPNSQYSFNKYKGIKRELKDDFPDGLKGNGVYSYPIRNILQNDDDAMMILKTKNKFEEELIHEKLKTALIVLLLTIILSFIIAMIISKVPIKLQKALLKAHDKLNDFGSIIDKYIISATTKKDSTIINVSSAFVDVSGYTKEELIGEKMSMIRDPQADKLIFQDLWKTILDGKTWAGEMKNKRKDGKKYWLEQNIIPTLDQNNTIESFVSLGVDITAKKELERLASIDKLTGIYNRRMIDEFIKIEVEVHKRHSYGLSVIMVDIDHFKLVNDTYGHQIGDLVLSQTVELIVQNSRKSDICGRYGGEEFILICPQTTTESAMILAEKIRLAVKNFTFEQVGHKTISLGICTFEDGDDVESLIKKADMALYKAKETGRDKLVVFEA